MDQRILQLHSLSCVCCSVSCLKESSHCCLCSTIQTSIFACKFKDGVILCADSRTSMGSYIANRTSNKLTQVADKVFCCRSGSGADTQAVAERVTHYADQHRYSLLFCGGVTCVPSVTSFSVQPCACSLMFFYVLFFSAWRKEVLRK